MVSFGLDTLLLGLTSGGIDEVVTSVVTLSVSLCLPLVETTGSLVATSLDYLAA